MRVLDAKPAASFASGDLRESRREARIGDRMLVAPPPPEGGGELVGREPRPIPVTAPAPEHPTVESGDLVAPAETRSSPPAETADPALPVLAVPIADAPPPAEEPVAVKLPRIEGLTVATGLPFRIPFLMEVLLFLLGGIGGYALGGLHPSLTALAGGIAAILIFRAAPASVRYNDEAPEAATSPDVPVRTP